MFSAILFALVSIPSVYATPGRVEVWFLAEATAKSSFHIPLLEKLEGGHFVPYSLLAQNEFDANCIPMGDDCFHPQIGIISKEKTTIQDQNQEKKEQEWKGKTFNSEDVQLVNCDKNYYFDLYCGKELKNVVHKNGLEIWIDNSGSLKDIDFPRQGDSCYRRTFAEKLRDDCHGKVQFSVYDMSIKTISDLSVICNHRGGNDTDRLIKWIKNSQAKELIVITDVSEMNDKFEIFLNSIGATIKGIGTKLVKASDLDNFIPDVKKFCQRP